MDLAIVDWTTEDPYALVDELFRARRDRFAKCLRRIAVWMQPGGEILTGGNSKGKEREKRALVKYL